MLPAVLTLLGTRVNALSPRFLRRRAEADTRPDESGFWYRLSRFVMRRPLPVATLSALFLIVLGLPFFGIKFDTVDPTVLPESASARQAYDMVSGRIPALPRDAVWIVVEGRQPRPRSARVAAAVAAHPGVAAVAAAAAAERRRDGDAGGLHPSVHLGGQPDHRAAPARPRRPRRDDALVGGATADFIDLQSSLTRHLPIAFAIIVLRR